MDYNQKNEMVFNNKSNKGIFLLISLVLVLIVGIIFIFIFSSIDKKDKILKTPIDINNKITTTTPKIIDKVTVNVPASSVEKIDMGVRKELNVVVLSRKENGEVGSFKIVDDKNRPDFDGDWLFDDEEQKYGTDPNNADTDGDGFSDWQEINKGTDPNKKDVPNKKKQ